MAPQRDVEPPPVPPAAAVTEEEVVVEEGAPQLVEDTSEGPTPQRLRFLLSIMRRATRRTRLCFAGAGCAAFHPHARQNQ